MHSNYVHRVEIANLYYIENYIDYASGLSFYSKPYIILRENIYRENMLNFQRIFKKIVSMQHEKNIKYGDQ